MLRHVPLILIFSAVFLAGCQTWPPQDPNKLPPTAALPQSSVPGEVQIYYWDNLAGTSVESLTTIEAYPNNPDLTETTSELRGITARGDNYGSLVRGYIIPPSTGLYTFSVSGDDETELWLSSSSEASQKSRIATVPGWTSTLEYNKYSSQRSADIELVEGERYYFELIHKEGGGADHFSAAWEGPGFSRQIISGESLASYAGEPGIASGEQGNEESYRLGYSVGYLDGSEDLAFKPRFPPLDEDQDGIYDNWETVHSLNPTDPSDANSDPDNDLLVAADEFLLGTSENKPDSDGDGIPDGGEYALELNPLDASDAQDDFDSDGVSNLDEYLAGTDPADSTSVPESGDDVATELAYTSGFAGQYFEGMSFNQFITARNDKTVQFQSGSGSFVEGQPNDNFSVRWYGTFTAPHTTGSRNYTFRVRTDDGARLYIDNEQRISAWRDQGATIYTATAALQPQQNVDVMMEYYEQGGAAVAQLSIVDDSTGAELLPGNVVRSPDLSVPSGVDSDGDGIPNTWELSHGLSPWQDDASEINNSSGVTNIEAFNSSLSPWTLQPLASPESPAVDDGSTSEPPATDQEASSVTLSWTAPLTRVDGSSIALSEIQSYEISYGTSPDNLTNTITVDGSRTSAEISGLSAGTWYFSISVIDTAGLESKNSEVVSHTIQ